jgi:hypothetical protein
MGLIVLERGRLLEWQTKKFDGPWSLQKQSALLNCIKKHVARYSISHIAVKVPSKATRSLNLTEAVQKIKSFSAESRIGFKTHTLDTMLLKWTADRKSTKKQFMKRLVTQFPDLLSEYRKELRIGNRHYELLFEAVAAADLTEQKLNK